MTTTEVERLRERVQQLEAQLAGAGPTQEPPDRSREHSRWRAVASATLIVLACVLAPLSVTAVWANNQVSNTDAYVETVAPLAQDPAIQAAVADRVTAEILRYVDVETITSDALKALSQQRDLPPRSANALQALRVPLVNGIESFTGTQVTRVVASPQFATVWEEANRAAHAQLVNLLSGEQGGAVTASNGEVTLDLAPIIAEAKQQLVAQGYTIASKVPEVDKTLVLVQSDSVTKAQSLYRLLDRLGSWLPVITLVLLGLGVYVARGHRRALIAGALGVAGGMLALGVALAVARPLYLDAVPADALPREAAAAVFDTLVRFLRNGLRTTAVLALLVALAAFVTGPSVTAVRTRSTLGRGIASLRGGAESHGMRTGPLGTWTFAHKRALQVATVAVGALTLTFWSRPTVTVVVGTAVVVVLVLGVIELLGVPPRGQRA